MSGAHLKGGISSARAALRVAMEESKSDMGLLDTTGRARSARAVLKPWDQLKSANPATEPLSFESLFKETGT